MLQRPIDQEWDIRTLLLCSQGCQPPDILRKKYFPYPAFYTIMV